jgi:hypothetical protein
MFPADSATIVVEMRNRKAQTTYEIVFAIEHYERDREGDLLWIDLLPADRAKRAEGYIVRLFND